MTYLRKFFTLQKIYIITLKALFLVSVVTFVGLALTSRWHLAFYNVLIVIGLNIMIDAIDYATNYSKDKRSVGLRLLAATITLIISFCAFFTSDNHKINICCIGFFTGLFVIGYIESRARKLQKQ